jgi:hypothetical protein
VRITLHLHLWIECAAAKPLLALSTTDPLSKINQ